MLIGSKNEKDVFYLKIFLIVSKLLKQMRNRLIINQNYFWKNIYRMKLLIVEMLVNKIKDSIDLVKWKLN